MEKCVHFSQLTLVLIGVFLLGAGAGIGASPVSVTVAGQPISFAGQQPVKHGERVLVPLRGVFEKLGATVDFNGATKTVTARDGQTDIQLTVGSKRASVDGKPITLDTSVRDRRGSILVPLRFVSENLGAQVNYDKSSGVVSLLPPGPRQSNQQNGGQQNGGTPAPPPSTSSPSQAGSSTPNPPPSQTGDASQSGNPQEGSSPQTSAPTNTPNSSGTTIVVPPANSSSISSTPSQTNTPPGPSGATTPPASGTTSTPSGTSSPDSSATNSTATSGTPVPVVAPVPQLHRMGSPTASVNSASPANTEANANYWPWLLGALVLLAVIGYFVNRRGKTGQVIASNDGKK